MNISPDPPRTCSLNDTTPFVKTKILKNDFVASSSFTGSKSSLVVRFDEKFIYDPRHVFVKKFYDNVVKENLNDETIRRLNSIDCICKCQCG